MPIYEETYRSWHGQLVLVPRAWWIIAKTGMGLLWKKWMIILNMAAFGSLIGHGIYIFFVTRGLEQTGVGQIVGTQFKINPAFFEGFIQRHWLLLVIVLLLAGAGIITNDRKFKALPLYFSKPVSFWDYTFGKFCIITCYGVLITMIPALLLFFFRVLLASDASYLKEFYWLPFAIMGHCLLMITTLAVILLAISASTRGVRTSAVFFFGLLYFTEIFRQIISRIPEIGLVSLSANFRQVGSVLFSLDRHFGAPAFLSFIALAAAIGLSIWVLRIRVKSTEVVR